MNKHTNILYSLKPGEHIEWYANTSIDLDPAEYDVIGPGHPEYDEMKQKYFGRVPVYEEQSDHSLGPYSLIIRKR